MARAFKAIDRDRVDAHALRRQRVAHAGAFVHDHDAVLLEFVDVFLGLVAGRLDDLDTALDDGLAIFRVRRRLDRGKDGEIDAERLVGEAAAARDLFCQVLRRRLRQRGDEAERAGVGNGCDQFRASHPLHPALHDRVFDADELGKSRPYHFLTSDRFPGAGNRARSVSFFEFSEAGCRHAREMSTPVPCGNRGPREAICRARDVANGAYRRNSLCSSPIPSIATVTALTGSFIAPTPIDVPQQIKSPGSRVMSCEILLTSCWELKIISEIG